ncbi:MAG: YceD family protein [Micropepsaceae bacterium]
MKNAAPFSYPFDLSSLAQAAREEAFVVPEAACQSLAEFYKVDSIQDFSIRAHLTRLSKNEFKLEGQFTASVLQTCIVTLKPVRSSIEKDFIRLYNVAPARAAQGRASAVNVQLEGDEIETLHGSTVDLAAPVLEELSLMIDPYPRIPGAAFEAETKAQSAEESPFAVLQTLKDKLEPPDKT